MTHDETPLDEDLSALVDGELAPDREAALRERVRVDPALAARLDAFERVGEALAALPSVSPSPSLRDALRARIEAERAGLPAPGRVRRQRAVWLGAAFAAAASVAVYFAYFAVAGSGSAPEPGSVREPVAAVDGLEHATDEELGIVLDYETLAGFDEPDVIEQLDLLERLAALAERKRG